MKTFDDARRTRSSHCGPTSRLGESIVTEIIGNKCLEPGAARWRWWSPALAFRLSANLADSLVIGLILMGSFRISLPLGVIDRGWIQHLTIQGKGMRYTDVAIVGGGLAGSTAAAMLGRAGVSALSDRPASDLSAGIALREARRRSARSPAQDRACRTDAAGHHARRRGLGSALRLRRRQEAERPARHHVRHAGQHHARANPARAWKPSSARSPALPTATSGSRSRCRTANRSRRGWSCSPTGSTSACAPCSASSARSSVPAIRSRSASTSHRSAARRSISRR